MKKVECYCPYCADEIIVDQGPGSYECPTCELSFTLDANLYRCPECDEEIVINEGPGLYGCDDCSTLSRLDDGGRLTLVLEGNKCMFCGEEISGVRIFGDYMKHRNETTCGDCGASVCGNCGPPIVSRGRRTARGYLKSHVCTLCGGRVSTRSRLMR